MKFKIKFITTLSIWSIITIVFLITYNIGLSLPNVFKFGGLYIWDGEIGEIWRLLTYGFIHKNFSHFINNLVLGAIIMLYFENKVGSYRTLVTFMFGLVIGGVGFLVFNEQETVITVGASAGIWAIFAASLFHIFEVEKVNILEFLVLFIATVFLIYCSITGININNIGHYSAYFTVMLCELIVIVVSDGVKNDKAFS